jgi:hypothetical protein
MVDEISRMIDEREMVGPKIGSCALHVRASFRSAGAACDHP